MIFFIIINLLWLLILSYVRFRVTYSSISSLLFFLNPSNTSKLGMLSHSLETKKYILKHAKNLATKCCIFWNMHYPRNVNLGCTNCSLLVWSVPIGMFTTLYLSWHYWKPLTSSSDVASWSNVVFYFCFGNNMMR